MSTAEPQDLISLIMRDHRDVEQVFSELEDRTADPGLRRQLADHVIAELVRHSIAEEEYVYPVARKRLSNGKELADRELRELSEAELMMKQLEGLDATDPKFDQLLGHLRDNIRHHVAEEETELLPGLRSALNEQELAKLGRKAAHAKRTAPTRPHPQTPDRPLADHILAPGEGMIDRIRNKFSGRRV